VNPLDHLDTIESSGRRTPRVLKNPETDAVVVIDPPSRPCPGCGHVTSEGESITRLFRVWWHHDCARSYLEGEGRDEAWLVLGHQLAERPSHFTAKQTKSIAAQLVRIASGGNRP
jgi:hypothetical protein